MLSWDQIAELQQRGIECGAHTHTHPELDMLSVQAAYEEIAYSKALVEDRLGVPVTSFAYPFGYYSAQTRQLVQQAGFTAACAVWLEMSSATDDLFALRRLIVTPEMDLDTFGACLERDTPLPEIATNRVKARIWTTYRRLTYTRRFAAEAASGQSAH